MLTEFATELGRLRFPVDNWEVRTAELAANQVNFQLGEALKNPVVEPNLSVF